MRPFRKDERIAQLAEVDVFSGCTLHQLEEIAKHTDEVSFKAGTTLMQEGKTGRECFVLLDGEAVVTIDGEPMAVLGPGAIVGEMALLEQEPRSATVEAWSKIRALVFTAREFNAVLDHAPAVAREVMRTISLRLRDVQAA